MIRKPHFALSASTLQRMVYVVGSLIFITSLVFVFAYAQHNWDSIRKIELTNPLLVVASAALYGISHVSTGLSWPLVLRNLGSPIPLNTGLQIGLIAQIGKYLPGNIAHYLGRAAISTSVGIGIKTTGISTAVEIVSAIVAAAFVATAATLIEPGTINFVSFQLTNAATRTAMLAFAVLVAVAVAFAIRYYAKGIGARILFSPAACLGVSFVLSGLSFSALIGAMGFTLEPVSMIAVFAIAWLIGFLVPGSPAGLGVREAILIAFVGPQIGTGSAIACALAHRVLTASVDALAAFIGYAWWFLSKKKKSANEVLSGSPTSHG